jgi:signal transduction histidine kinase
MQRSPSRTGMPALVGLLLVVFAIAGLLVYEAWNTGRSRREIAERGLQDYAAYASWSAARAGENTLTASLSTIFRGIAGNRVADTEPVTSITTLLEGARYLAQCDCAMDLPADYYFRLDIRSDEMETQAYDPPAPNLKIESSWAAAKVGSYTVQPSAPELIRPDNEWIEESLRQARLETMPNFAMYFASQNGEPRVVGVAPQRDSSGKIIGALGFVTPAKRFADVTFTYLWRNPKILPAAITRGMPNDSLLAAVVTTPEGTEIYRSRGWIDGLRSDTASLGAFGGGMRMKVALRPDATIRLPVVPVSRVPVWVGLLMLTGLLTVIIVRNLQREHELARLRLEFSASVSHELRTPLAQILLFGETLTLNRTRSDTEKSTAANVIVREARRLMHLVDNTLTFSRAERPVVSLSPRRQELAPLVREVIAGFVPLAAAREVTFTENLNEQVEGFVDGEAFRQIVLNLLDNAVKYGPVAGRVSVGLTRGHTRLALEPSQKQKHVVRRATVRLTVDDQGPGVSGRAKDEIWVPFARGMNGEAPVGTGCGLGLAVVRELAERHNGSAWVESAPGGRGSRFVIELPDASEKEEIPALEPVREDAPAGVGVA